MTGGQTGCAALPARSNCGGAFASSDSALGEMLEVFKNTELIMVLSDFADDAGVGANSTGVSAVYVDVENIRGAAGYFDPEFAQDVVQRAVQHWPSHRPPLGTVHLYVPAYKAESWDTWVKDLVITTLPAGSQCQAYAEGVQQFSRSSKNCADMTIAIDAFDALYLSRQANFVAVISSDSDFCALFRKIKMMEGNDVSNLPFMWIVPPGSGVMSNEVRMFIPERYFWDLSPPVAAASIAKRVGQVSAEEKKIADTLIRELAGQGEFTATRAQATIQKFFPNSQLAKVDGPSFGIHLADNLWPVIEINGGSKYKPDTGSWRYVIPALDYRHTWDEIADALNANHSNEIVPYEDTIAILNIHWPNHPLVGCSHEQFCDEWRRRVFPKLVTYGWAEHFESGRYVYLKTESPKPEAI